jgi:hypothetical protein
MSMRYILNERTIPAGHVLFKEGDVASSVFFIQSGTVSMSSVNDVVVSVGADEGLMHHDDDIDDDDDDDDGDDGEAAGEDNSGGGGGGAGGGVGSGGGVGGGIGSGLGGGVGGGRGGNERVSGGPWNARIDAATERWQKRTTLMRKRRAA